MIEIEDLYKYYGERKAVGPLSFSIEKGEIVGLLGLNGAGKTTTLRILACDLLPSAGRVVVEGLDLFEHPHEVRSMIGYLPDTPPVYPEMTVSDYLSFAARLRGMKKEDVPAAVDRAIASTQLDSVRGDVIASLSHGYRQRVGIAQAIVHRPRLLVLDEPITGLDPVQIVEMRELLRGLRGAHTILLSSHILSEISETCDRILVIQNGQIAASGTEAELTRRLAAGSRVEVTVLGDEARALDVARAVAGVAEVTVVPTAEPSDRAVALLVEAETDVREELCRALVGAGLGVLELRRSDDELENVFLRLAADGTAAPPKAAPEATA